MTLQYFLYLRLSRIRQNLQISHLQSLNVSEKDSYLKVSIEESNFYYWHFFDYSNYWSTLFAEIVSNFWQLTQVGFRFSQGTKIVLGLNAQPKI